MPARRRGLDAAAIALTAVALTILQYGTTIGYGFYYDDYHFIHPYSAGDLRAVFHGTWDPAGIEVPFYRPITIAFFAARFAVLGLNADAYHALSLTLFAAAALLAGTFVWRAMGGALAGVLAAAAFVVHPGVPYSAVAWVTNQMHCLQLLIVLTGLHWWFFVRRRTAAWWLPLVLLQVVALLVKEDGVMLIPAVIVLHTLRKAIVERDLKHVPVAFLAAAAIVVAALLALRSSFLHGIGGYHLPPLERAWSNLTRGLVGVLRLTPATRHWQAAASWFATLLPPIALACWRRISPATRFGLLAGVAIAILFDLPFAFVVKAEQLYLVTMGAAVLLAASAVALLEAAPTVAVRAAAGIAIAAGLASMAAVARDISRDFEPYGPNVRYTDAIVREWAAVPAELRDYLLAKRQPGAREQLPSNPAKTVEVVGFGLHGFEPRPDGSFFRWMSQPTAELYVRPDARLVTIGIRHEAGVFQEPASVRIRADGRLTEEAVLKDGSLRRTSVALRPQDVSGLSRMHRVSIEIDRVWIPADVIRGSTDRRPLGLQVGPIEVR